jgi:D-xylose transport system substrate-binding protein
MKKTTSIATAVATAAFGLAVFAGTAPRAADAIKIAFLMPCTKCADRWETKDRPFFIDIVKSLDPSIEVLAVNAEGDGNRQIQQGEAALTQGVKVIVVNTIQEGTAAPIVREAQKENVGVIAYDGLIKGVVPNGYVSFNNQQVGELQAQYLVDHLPAGANIAVINGDQVCDACRAFKIGAHKVLDPLVAANKIKIVYEADTKEWLASNAQREVEQALTATGDKIDGIVAANDTLAQGAIAALKGRHLNGKVLVTGQDASDAAITHILEGDQAMTVYKALQAEAGAAAKGAVALAKGQDVSGIFTEKVKTDAGDVPALLLKPTVVDKSNIADTVIKDGFTKKADVCKGTAAAACNF